VRVEFAGKRKKLDIQFGNFERVRDSSADDGRQCRGNEDCFLFSGVLVFLHSI